MTAKNLLSKRWSHCTWFSHLASSSSALKSDSQRWYIFTCFHISSFVRLCGKAGVTFFPFKEIFMLISARFRFIVMRLHGKLCNTQQDSASHFWQDLIYSLAPCFTFPLCDLPSYYSLNHSFVVVTEKLSNICSRSDLLTVRLCMDFHLVCTPTILSPIAVIRPAPFKPAASRW